MFNVVFPKQLSAESEKVTFIPRIFSNRGETKLQAPIFLCSSWLHIYSEKTVNAFKEQEANVPP